MKHKALLGYSETSIYARFQNQEFSGLNPHNKYHRKEVYKDENRTMFMTKH